MCGITGTYTFESGQIAAAEISALNRSLGMLQHRGPDFQASAVQEGFACGHARLSIIDLNPEANQPFKSEDGRYILCYNGEIYNFPDLKEELEKDGVIFRTSSDTEVLLYWLIKFGKAGLNKLNGFFAFAFFDTREHELLIARDSMGQKPIYYHSHDSGIRFCSELRSITPYLAEPKPDHEALSLYLQLGYFPAPYSALLNVAKLEAGHLLEVNRAGIVKQSWFDLPCLRTEQDPVDTDLYDKLTSAVERRMVSDRPLGTFLSGGIDSSIITMLATEFKGDLDSFSIGFDNSKYLDESEMAAKVAKDLGTRHHRIAFEDYGNEKLLESFQSDLDEPFADSSAIAYFVLSEFASKRVCVALSGDGADELFGGYRKHRAHLMLRNPFLNLGLRLISPKKGNRENAIQDRMRKLGKLAVAARMKPRERYWYLATFSHEDPNEYLNSDTIPDSIKDQFLTSLKDDRIRSILCTDQQLVLPNDMLHKADRMSMRHGLEVRSPFMDPHVVNLASTLKKSELLNFRKGKLELRSTFRYSLIKDVWKQPKKGFEIPLQSLLINDWNRNLEAALAPEKLDQLGIFDTDAVISMIQSFKKQPDAESAFLLWAIFIAQSWYKDIL